jgi:hypothetical protein
LCARKGRLVGDVEIAAQLKGALALGRVHEQGDGHEVVGHRQLAAVEDRPARDAELLAARLALEQAPGAVFVAGDAAAGRADRLTIGRVPAERPEEGERLFLAHARDREDAERPGGGDEEEVLGQASHPVRMNRI